MILTIVAYELAYLTLSRKRKSLVTPVWLVPSSAQSWQVAPQHQPVRWWIWGQGAWQENLVSHKSLLIHFGGIHGFIPKIQDNWDQDNLVSYFQFFSQYSSSDFCLCQRMGRGAHKAGVDSEASGQSEVLHRERSLKLWCYRRCAGFLWWEEECWLW